MHAELYREIWFVVHNFLVIVIALSKLTAKEPGQPTQLAVPETMRLAQAMLDDALRRAQAAAAREKELQGRVEALLSELGEAKGRLAAQEDVKYRPPSWIKALFGSRGRD